jgi:hypothetical protein
LHDYLDFRLFDINSLLDCLNNFTPLKKALFGNFHSHNLQENIRFCQWLFITKLNRILFREHRGNCRFCARLAGTTRHCDKAHIGVMREKLAG